MLKLIILSSFLMCASPLLLRAQESNSTYRAMDSLTPSLSASHLVWHDVKEGTYDGIQYLVSPLHWNAQDWLTLGAAAGVTVALEHTLDAPIKNLVRQDHTAVGNTLASFGNDFYGNGYATGLAAISLYTIGLTTDNARLRIIGRQIIQSFVYAGITTTALKVLFGRARPYTNNGPNAFHGFTLNDAWNSLPSGHTTVACALSETLAANIDEPWAYAAFYTFEGITVFGRIRANAHWFSDTFLGAVIGNFTGYWVSRQTEHYDLKTNEPQSTSLVIGPTANGISLAYRF